MKHLPLPIQNSFSRLLMTCSLRLHAGHEKMAD